MSLTEGLLVVIIIILIIVSVRNKHHPQSHVHTLDCIDRSNGKYSKIDIHQPHGKHCNCRKCKVPEAAALKEHAEYFDDPTATLDVKATLGNCDDTVSVCPSNSFWGASSEFKDWAQSQAVDPQVLKNHAEFVKDRFNTTTQNITGRTFTPQMQLNDTQQIVYVGLRKPEAIPEAYMGNPDQVPDVDKDWYAKKPTFTWSSST